MITILLADDHQIVRQGVRTLLEMEADLRVIGEADDGLEACRLIQELKPDILVLDLMMDGLDGIETARWVTKHARGTGVVVLSMYSSECYVLEALKAGARGYVLKRCTSDDLAKAIREVSAGRRYLRPPVSDIAMKLYGDEEESVSTPLRELTARERDVFHLVVQGFTNAEVAESLYISRRTAEAHRASMMHKLGLHRHVDLIMYALKGGVSKEEVLARPNWGATMVPIA